MSFLHQKPARLLLAASVLGLLVIVGAVFATSAFAFSHSLAPSLDGYSTEEVTVGLQHAPVGSTNLKWNATTRDLTVTIVMSGLAPVSTHPAHIHVGNCNSNGPIKYTLNDVTGDKVGHGSSTTTIHNVS